MDNLGDWLYIVLLVAAGLSGLLSSGKKKKQPVEVPPEPETDIFAEEPERETRSFWEVLEDVQKEQSRQQKPKVKPQPQKYQQAQQVKQVKDEKNILTNRSFIDMENAEEDAFRLSSESFQNTDELKKAIIYSEILNRRY